MKRKEYPMSKFRKNVLSVRKNRLTQSGQLSLEAAGLSTILWKKDVPDSPLFQFFFLSDLEEFMSVLVDINEEELQDVMNSLTSKGFLSVYYQLDIDQETNVRDRVFLIQKLQQNEILFSLWKKEQSFRSFPWRWSSRNAPLSFPVLS